MNKRLFVAIDPPLEIREQLRMLCCGLPNARWVAPEQFHLTLSFIGETEGSAFLDIREALAEISAPKFSLQLQGVGFFPPRGQPRVVWAGIERNELLQVLQRKIITRLFHLGLEPENRKFSPHITLARLQHTPTAKVGKYLENNGLFQTFPFLADHFTLYSSILGRKGATHLVERQYQLV
ncbi:MAG: RNA 2',3'-cyclic phosphodiesterase [Desulfobulbus sp.]